MVLFFLWVLVFRIGGEIWVYIDYFLVLRFFCVLVLLCEYFRGVVYFLEKVRICLFICVFIRLFIRLCIYVFIRFSGRGSFFEFLDVK